MRGQHKGRGNTDSLWWMQARQTLAGRTSGQWSEWFGPLVIKNEATLTGLVGDQAELFGLLTKVRDLNLTLLALYHVEQTQT